MSKYVRAGLAGLLATAFFALLAPAAQAAFGVTEPGFEAGTCNNPNCVYSSPKSQFFTQAAGHPEWGITSVELNSKENILKQREPEGSLKRLRVDVPPGLAANPEALPKCSIAQFNSDSCPANTEVGETRLTAFVLAVDTEFTGQVYNLQPEAGLPLEFGIHVNVQPIANEHILLKGHVEWNSDYHEWFEIDNISNAIPVLKSKLLFKGHAGIGNFLTLPSVCSPSTTSHVEVESYAHEISRTDTHTPVGVDGCGAVPFKPTTTITPEANSASSDKPDGATTVVAVPQNVAPGDINTADIKDARVTLPEGLTLNPSAAHGLEACTPGQIGIGTRQPVTCPAASRVGSVAIETDLPKGALTGAVYLGGPEPKGASITDPPFTIYIDAESNLDVSVRLRGQVSPNPATGRLEVSFLGNPQLPFSELRLTLNGGEHAPLANPLGCAGVTEFNFSAFTGASAIGTTPFQATGCPGTIPFSLGQSTTDSTHKAGAYTNYTFNLTRAEGQQYVQRLTTTLPAGLVGAIPSVPLCGEPEASQGTCPASSLIGTANVTAGSGDAYPFSGSVYLTGPYNGAPYGLSIPVEAKAGPFDLGKLVTRVSIGVDPHSARVIAASTLPTIFKGVPLRLRNISVLVNRPNFLFNPTYCGPLSQDSSLTSTSGTGQSLSSAFPIESCSSLPFKPKFEAATSASTDPTTAKANGASLKVNLLQGMHEANIRSVVASLPKQLPSRLTTLQKACPEATYAANPFACPPGSKVGTATVSTPVLPDHLTGPAYLVSHGGAAFPDLDLLLEGDGVRVFLVGNTQIKNGITTSTFGSIPDVPVTSFVLDLPQGPNSALAVNGKEFCTQTLIMPTTITAQSGTVIKQETNVGVANCTGGKGKTRFKILSKKIVHNKLVVRVQTFAPGRISIKSRYLRTTFKRVAKAGKFTIKAPLSRKGRKAQSARKLKFKARVGFLPKNKAEAISAVFTRVGFKHPSKHKKRKR
ncbi:MAG: hypothetical protein ACYDHT_12975 [Solirubrobacteraceae bacterium]